MSPKRDAQFVEKAPVLIRECDAVLTESLALTADIRRGLAGYFRGQPGLSAPRSEAAEAAARDEPILT
jgi:hypothetical protein